MDYLGYFNLWKILGGCRSNIKIVVVLKWLPSFTHSFVGTKIVVFGVVQLNDGKLLFTV